MLSNFRNVGNPLRRDADYVHLGGDWKVRRREKLCDEFCDILRIAIGNMDIFGNDHSLVAIGLTEYGDFRLNHHFEPSQLNRILPLLKQVADYMSLAVPSIQGNVVNNAVLMAMNMLTSVRFLTEDFPGHFEDLAYSKQVLQLEEHIGKMRDGPYSFADFKTYWRCKTYSERLPTCTWYALWEPVEELNGNDVETAKNMFIDELEAEMRVAFPDAPPRAPGQCPLSFRCV